MARGYEVRFPNAPFVMGIVFPKLLKAPIRKCTDHSAQVALCLEYLGAHFLIHVSKLDPFNLEARDEVARSGTEKKNVDL